MEPIFSKKNEKRKRYRSLLILGSLIILCGLTGCADYGIDSAAEGIAKAGKDSKSIILSTTTSPENSGLLDAILPIFTEDTGIEVKVVAVGTGKALKMGEDGDADVLIVHDKASEEQFIEEGHGIERFDLMYNNFILVGPKDDFLNLSNKASNQISKAFSIIYKERGKFVSRGDDSGTHKMELRLWKEINTEPTGAWYIEAGQGMGAILQMASELKSYTLTDNATYLSMKDTLNLKIVVEDHEKLFNPYGIIAVNPEKNHSINNAGAEIFIEWMLSEKGQSLIEEFGKEIHGESLFIPNGK